MAGIEILVGISSTNFCVRKIRVDCEAISEGRRIEVLIEPEWMYELISLSERKLALEDRGSGRSRGTREKNKRNRLSVAVLNRVEFPQKFREGAGQSLRPRINEIERLS